MRAFFGALLIAAALVLIYLFGALGIIAAKGANLPQGVSLFSLPLQTLGAGFPKDALCLTGGLAAAGLGLYLFLRGAAGTPAAPAAPLPLPTRDGPRGARMPLRNPAQPAVTTGTFSRGFCLLSLGACLAWGVAAIGAGAGAQDAVIGGFVAVAALAMLEALILGILGSLEKGKPVIVLVMGWCLFLASAGMAVAGFVLGG
jgi:hypothetical protein